MSVVPFNEKWKGYITFFGYHVCLHIHMQILYPQTRDTTFVTKAFLHFHLWSVCCLSITDKLHFQALSARRQTVCVESKGRRPANMQFQNHHLSWQWFSFSSVFFNFTFINIRLWTMNYTCILVSQDMRWLYLSPKIFAVVPSHQMRVDGVADLEPCSTQRYHLPSWGFTNYFYFIFYPKKSIIFYHEKATGNTWKC